MHNELNFPSSNDIITEAYHRFKRHINDEIDTFIESQERRHTQNWKHILKITIEIVAPTIYILAVATSFDKLRASILVLLAFLYGIFKVGMLSLKFFRELLIVVIEWQKNRLKIEGIRYIYIIMALCFLLLVLLLVLIFMVYSSKG